MSCSLAAQWISTLQPGGKDATSPSNLLVSLPSYCQSMDSLLEMIHGCWYIEKFLSDSSQNTSFALCFSTCGRRFPGEIVFTSPSTPPQMVGQIRKVPRSFCLRAPKGRDTDIPCGTHDILPQFSTYHCINTTFCCTHAFLFIGANAFWFDLRDKLCQSI